ncbi:MAG: TonB family protein [Arenicella sp.]|nr:TonB family protein [Arenicella sp.]
MILKSIIIAALLIPSVSISSKTLAQQQKVDKKFSSDEFRGPQMEKREAPKYPISMLKLGHTGLVEIEITVDETGTVKNAVVIQSTDPDFEKNSLDAVLAYEIKPATYQGKDVSSRDRIVVRYEVEVRTWNEVGRNFLKIYRKIAKELEKDKPNEKKLSKLFKRADKVYLLTMYSLSRLKLAQAKFSEHFKDQRTQLKALTELVLFEAKYLADSERQQVLTSIVKHQINLGFYGEAIESYSTLQKEFPDAIKTVEPVIQKVNAILIAEQSYVRKFQTDQRGNDFVELTNPAFFFQNTSGVINKLKLRCQTRSTELEYSPENDYRLPPSWGKCSLQIIGEPGANGELIQVW